MHILYVSHICPSVVQRKTDTKANIRYNALERKVTVFSTIYFPASSHPVFVFLFLCKITMVALV